MASKWPSALSNLLIRFKLLLSSRIGIADRMLQARETLKIIWYYSLSISTILKQTTLKAWEIPSES